jgi:biopolymer transport protein ExbD/biopolymer transport protein TolR
MGMSAGDSGGFNSDINVTPMVDIMLVLLIIFMVVTPMLQKGVTVALPRDMDNPEEDQAIIKETSVVISIPTNGQYYIGKEQYPKDQLGEKIKKLMERKAEEEKIVYIKSGVAVDYGEVVDVLNTIRKEGIERVGLVADKKKGPGGKDS